MPELCGKLTFRLNLRYHALYEKIWLREEDRLGNFTRAKRSTKPRRDRNIYVCGILNAARLL